jgi:hypothetical protein
MIRDRLVQFRANVQGLEPHFGPFRAGDVRSLLGYEPN